MTTIRKEGGLDETADVVVQISNDDTSDSVDLQYFAVKENTIDEAVALVREVLSDNDSNLKGYWLLTQIDHWDFEQERLVLLSDNSLIICSFNFRFKYLKEWKIIPLQLISEVLYGNPIYPSTALIWSSERKHAVKISLKGSEPGFFQRWNPFSSDIPFTIFESHILERKGKVTDDTRLQVQNFVQTLGEVMQAAGQDVSISEGSVQLYSYFNLWGAVYNQSRMGFHKTRGFGSWEMR